MVGRMIFQNILHRPIRTVVSVLAVAIEVGMVMLVVGLTHGMLQDSANRIGGVGADIMVESPSASQFLGMTTAPMPVKLGDYFAKIQHVQAVTPVLFQFTTSAGISMIWGIDMQSWDRVTGGFVYHEGGPFTGTYDILVDDLYAASNHVRVGQTINLLNHDFRVCGIVEHGKGSRLFIPLDTMESVVQLQGRVSIFFIKCTNPGYTEDVIDSVKKLLPDYKILSVQDYMTTLTSNDLPQLKDFIAVLVGVAVTIGFLVIFLSMYTTITERTREIGILKSLGATKRYIIELILREAALLGMIGVLAGYGGTLLANKLILEAFPTLTVELTIRWALWAALLAMAGTLIGAFYPALRAARLDPVDALAYE
jgi:putative ABC transport system permease protein